MGIRINAPVSVAKETSCEADISDEKNGELRHNERLVYNAICQSSLPQKAYDLLDKLQDQGVRAPMTVYRALGALIEKGRVKKIESLNAYIALKSTESRAILICKKCSQVKEITLDDALVADLFSPISVVVKDVCIEAFSDCIQICDGNKCGGVTDQVSA